MRKLLLILLAVVIVAIPIIVISASQTRTMTVTYTWTPPLTGNPVDHYVVELSVDGGAFLSYTPTEPVTLEAVAMEYGFGHTYQIRVAGVDAQGRQGPFSEPSDPYLPDAGAPGQPGKPVRLEL